ncbi:DUF4406 domain-containing protein [Flavobacterium sp. I-SCBP12n]|uniref:DUF4406 domain-containing protein n=1 Tax=Flavobacterium pygoscelis TaxID=2893176 RepID=A0A9X1XUX5_9FLAO|nr:DUF4406 domain-containing protein [Flavobacterium pygoscelis]MCK8143181.1 DUF4406 domain-containing protein [Flavobacterium pygoscelis]
MKQKIYIAGKVTGEPIEECRIKFKIAQLELEAKGFIAINPLEIVTDSTTPWFTAMRMCVSVLVNCDAVVLLPCWEDSTGAKIERKLAEDLQILICNYTPFGLTVLQKHQWNN